MEFDKYVMNMTYFQYVLQVMFTLSLLHTCLNDYIYGRAKQAFEKHLFGNSGHQKHQF